MSSLFDRAGHELIRTGGTLVNTTGDGFAGNLRWACSGPCFEPRGDHELRGLPDSRDLYAATT